MTKFSRNEAAEALLLGEVSNGTYCSPFMEDAVVHKLLVSRYADSVYIFDRETNIPLYVLSEDEWRGMS